MDKGLDNICHLCRIGLLGDLHDTVYPGINQKVKLLVGATVAAARDM
jgi:hypothetical protein